MNSSDRVSSLFWLAVSIFVCLESSRSDLGTFNYPGPGFFPFCSGIVLGTFSLLLFLIRTIKGKGTMNVATLWHHRKWSRVILVTGTLVLYAVVMPRIGYVITTFVLMSVLFILMDRSKMGIRGLIALIVVLVTYILFQYLLDIRLPKGVLGF